MLNSLPNLEKYCLKCPASDIDCKLHILWMKERVCIQYNYIIKQLCLTLPKYIYTYYLFEQSLSIYFITYQTIKLSFRFIIDNPRYNFISKLCMLKFYVREYFTFSRRLWSFWDVVHRKCHLLKISDNLKIKSRPYTERKLNLITA